MTTFEKAGFDLLTIVFGGIGALLGITYSPPMTKKEMVAALIAGFACAALGPELVAQFITLPAKVNNALGFLFGLGGMFIVPGLLALWRGFAVDPWGFIDRIRGIKKPEGDK